MISQLVSGFLTSPEVNPLYFSVEQARIIAAESPGDAIRLDAFDTHAGPVSFPEVRIHRSEPRQIPEHAAQLFRDVALSRTASHTL